VPLLVQKYGGTSVADPEKILRAARRAIAAHRRGSQVVVVVSARGDATDDLIAMARQISARPPARELDMLLATGEQVSVALMAIAIESLGVPAISFTAAQIGILTDSLHTRARIREISTERVFQALGEGKIVIVAGFQGVDRNAEITTLGRGGSDTTAVALAAVLGADACEVYTDVNGVSTADPRKAGQVRYWQYGLAGNSPNLAKSDPSRFPLPRFPLPKSDPSRFPLSSRFPLRTRPASRFPLPASRFPLPASRFLYCVLSQLPSCYPCKVSVGIASRSEIACRWVKDGVEFFCTAGDLTAPMSWAVSHAIRPLAASWWYVPRRTERRLATVVGLRPASKSARL